MGQIIAQAFFAAGRYVQTFATYGGERRGAPVTAFVRVAAEPITRRCDVQHPSLVMLFDPTFLEDGTGLAGLRPGATVIANTVQPPHALQHYGPYRFATLDALAIARRHGLGRIVNTAMLGAFCRITGAITVEQMEAALRRVGTARLEQNVAALREACERVSLQSEVAHRA